MSLVAGWPPGPTASMIWYVASRRDGAAVHRDQSPINAGDVSAGFTFGHVRQLDAVASRALLG